MRILLTFILLCSSAAFPSDRKPLWLPMCFFYDSAVDVSKTNTKLKALVSAYASCGIELDVLAFELNPGYPQDPSMLLKSVVNACPIPQENGIRGSIQVETATNTPA